MQAGDLVGYVKDPALYGPLTVVEITFRGWVVCEDKDGVVAGKFQPHELDDAKRFWTAAGASA